jgi:type IV secretory pathway ATPase VirB11/archaellum biosynthesis ATPase
MTVPINPLLGSSLAILASHFGSGEVEELAINRVGEIWRKCAMSGWQVQPDERLSEDYLLTLCRHLANVSGQSFHPVHRPILYTSLPQGHRFTALVGAAVRYDRGDSRGIAITVRLFDPDRRIAFERYGLTEGAPLPGQPIRHGHRRYDPAPLEDLLAAVAHREAILISGATATGKTSFLNRLVDFLPLDGRVLTVEDAREVTLPQANRVHLVVSRIEAGLGIDFMAVVDAAVRLTPDVIICGEIGITNAPAVFRLMTTGHTNFMATIHAHSPEAALRAFYQNLAQANPGIDAAAAIEIIGSSFGRIVQIDRQGGRRMVTAIDIPALTSRALGHG